MASLQNSSGNGLALDMKPKAPEHGLEAFAHQAGERAGALATDIAHTASEYTKNSRAYVKENPAKGVAIAAFAGMLTGSLLTMAMRRRS